MDEARAAAIISDILDGLRDVIRRHRVRLEGPGYAPLTTQVYFAGDPWLEHDVVGAARPSLVTKLEPGDSGFVCHFDFTLAPAS